MVIAPGYYNVKNLNTSLERLKSAGSIFFLLPGPKMIWQFGEVGYDISIDYNGRLGKSLLNGIILMSLIERISTIHGLISLV